MSGKQNREFFYIEVGAWEVVRENGQPKVVLHPGRPLAELDKKPATKPRSNRAAKMQAMLDAGVVRNRAELAKHFKLSRARVSQILGPTRRESV